MLRDSLVQSGKVGLNWGLGVFAYDTSEAVAGQIGELCKICRFCPASCIIMLESATQV